MTASCYVTTSWDDGFISDMRLAKLLSHYGVPGTFYIPRDCDRSVLGQAEVRDLASTFEIGAHTLTHSRLTNLREDEAAAEITGSKRYIEQITGLRCRVFAPPGGYFRPSHLRIAGQAGFLGFRTTELLNCRMPAKCGPIVVMPTALQAYVHPVSSYFRNALKRFEPANLATFFRHVRGVSLAAAFDSLLDRTITAGGVLHIWGHSWELDECGSWETLEFMLARLAERKDSCRMVTNSALCDAVLPNEYDPFSVSNPVLPR